MSNGKRFAQGKSRRGRHIGQRERYDIETLLANGFSVAGVAEWLGRPRETIYREVNRGRVEQIIDYHSLRHGTVYKADYAQRVAERRQAYKGQDLKLGNNHELAQAIEGMVIKEGYSPDAALARLRKEGWSGLFCTKTLYNYIHGGVLGITMDDLPMKGRQKKKKARRYKDAHHAYRGKSIEIRPDVVKGREEFGHWEGDLIVGRQGTKAVVMTLVERKTRYAITFRLKGKDQKYVKAAFDRLERTWGTLFKVVFKTVTFDNGGEFADWRSLELSQFKNRRLEGSRTEVFYAHPYCSSERGSNENLNGLLRRRIPKGRNIGLLTDGYIKDSTAWLNDYPRRILKYLSAKEAFDVEIEALRP